MVLITPLDTPLSPESSLAFDALDERFFQGMHEGSRTLFNRQSREEELAELFQDMQDRMGGEEVIGQGPVVLPERRAHCCVTIVHGIRLGGVIVSEGLVALTDRAMEKIEQGSLSKWNWLWLIPASFISNVLGCGLVIVAIVVESVAISIFALVALASRDEALRRATRGFWSDDISALGRAALANIVKAFYPPFIRIEQIH